MIKELEKRLVKYNGYRPPIIDNKNGTYTINGNRTIILKKSNTKAHFFTVDKPNFNYLNNEMIDYYVIFKNNQFIFYIRKLLHNYLQIKPITGNEKERYQVCYEREIKDLVKCVL